MRLVLIRHGESEHAFRGNIAGVCCSGLTESGAKQAQDLADRLRATGEFSDCCTLLSRPVPRARQTAAILAPALSLEAIEEDDNLSHRNGIGSLQMAKQQADAAIGCPKAAA
jgi:probable phosphoglycerate mutase